MAVKQKHVKTTSGSSTTAIKVAAQYDYVTVVGASHTSFWEDVRGQKGNMMRFINQGIRQIRQYPETTESYTAQRVFLIFIEAYPRALLDAVKKVVENRYKAAYRELDSISQLVDFINQRLQKKRLVKQLDFFSHGLVGSVEFGYSLDKEDTYRLRDAQARMLKPEAFEYDAKIYSYACRTGLGNDIGGSLDKGEDPAYTKSLAQILADSTDTEVWAYPRRSNYDQTYGTEQQRKAGTANKQKVKDHDEALRQYHVALAKYQQQKKADPKSEAKAPTPPKKTFTDEEERQARHTISRDRNENQLGYPLDEEGAPAPVRAGDTPTGLPETLLQFKPQAWGQKKS